MTRLPLLCIALLACSEYDLTRPEDVEEPPEEEPVEDPPAPEDTGPAPDIDVSPSSIDFGFVGKGCTSDQEEITITNVGTWELEVTAVELEGDGAGYFSVAAGQLPLYLQPGESKVLTADFSPIATAELEIDIVVTSNDPDEPEVDVALSGAGADGSNIEESFTQEIYTEVDVLWIIDNSGSMSSILNHIGDNFETFIDQFLEFDLDYQIAVVTTDMDNPDQSGRFVGFISPSDSDPSAAFLDAVNQGATGSANERGLDATQAALSEPLISGENQGFLRDDAALATIVVSDENDFSSVDVDDFVDWYTGLKDDPADVSFSAICGDKGLGCSEWASWGDLITATSGARYIDTADATGGMFQSICTDNFNDALEYLSTQAVGMRVSWELSEEPSDISSIVVLVDGEEIDYSSIDGWSYNSDTNSIVFNGDSMPPAGSVIEISYTAELSCD